MSSFGEMFGKLLHATGQSRAAKTVEIYGWLIFAEGILIFLFLEHVALLLRLWPARSRRINVFPSGRAARSRNRNALLRKRPDECRGIRVRDVTRSAARAADYGCPLVLRKITRLPRAALRGAGTGQFFVDTVDVACGAPKIPIVVVGLSISRKRCRQRFTNQNL